MENFYSFIGSQVRLKQEKLTFHKRNEFLFYARLDISSNITF